MTDLSTRIRTLVLLFGAAAVGAGMAYMAAAGAPPRYMLVNLAALVLGATAWLALDRAGGARLAKASGPVVLALAASLLLTAWFGLAIGGAARWVSLGPLNLQVSLVALPVMLVLYARRPDRAGTAGMIVAAFALAVQPDRAMAGVMAGGLLGLLVSAPGRLPLAASAASVAAFGWTLLTPDRLPAVPYVDRILYTAFDVHPLAGLAVAAGAAGLGLPALLFALRAEDSRPALLAFGGCWLAAVVAAALGDYPTPLVGYGGSAILGYLLSGALLPAGTRAGARGASGPRPVAGPGADGRTLKLCPGEVA
ncbi:MAG TPA: hypothetical protein VF574_11135 [Allosphingosinicella sp.]|jgi:hypothetical protein